MTKEFVTYEQALALRELGFDEPCLAFYSMQLRKPFNITFHQGLWESNTSQKECRDNYLGMLAPLYQQAFRFFREVYKINPQIAFCEYSIESENSWKFTFDNPTGRQYWEGEFKTYEEAEQACLDKLIQIVKAASVQE